MSRQYFDDGLGQEMIFFVDGMRFNFTELFIYAEIGDLPAGITNYVFKTLDGKYLRVTVVSEDKTPSAYGVFKGWYTGYFVDKMQAEKTKESWSILREQPGSPSGPWK